MTKSAHDVICEILWLSLVHRTILGLFYEMGEPRDGIGFCEDFEGVLLKCDSMWMQGGGEIIFPHTFGAIIAANHLSVIDDGLFPITLTTHGSFYGQS